MSYFNFEWIEKYLKKIPTVIFDIGSNNGADGAKFKSAYPDANVVSIEADPELVKKSEVRFKNLKLKDMQAFNYAVCDLDGYIDFYPVVSSQRGAGSIHKPTRLLKRRPDIKFGDPIKVPCIRLDTFCAKNSISHIDIIHMDIQSAEYRALIGLGEIRPKMIFLEVSLEKNDTYANSNNSTSEKLTEMGYEMREKIAGDELWTHKIQ